MAFDLLNELESKTGLLTIQEVADVFNISVRTVNRQISTRNIPSILIAGQRRFDPGQLIRWVTKKSPKIQEGRQSAQQ